MSTSEASLEELKNEIRQFCEERDWDKYHAPKELATGMVIEAAELLDNFRAMSEKDQFEAMADPKRAKKIRDELADTFYWILRFSQKYDINLSEALRSKMEQNKAKYPVEKARGSRKKYDEYD
jgi:NTP pyrophosphatase (non-canonical NTP hydrolase)